MKLFRITRMLAVLTYLLAVSISCSDDDDSTLVPTTPTVDVMVKDTKLGKVLTDGNGKTLYFFTKDVSGASACSGACTDTWPVFSVSNLRLDTGLNAADFSSITRTDGTLQVAYKGWPLYYFKNDAVAGDVNGENVNKVWFVAKTDYTIMLANAQLVGLDGKNYKADYTEGAADTQFFVDESGRTLYGFAIDKKNKNNYTKPDFSNDGQWPIYTTDMQSIPSSLDKSLFGTIDVFGKKQLTYKGWPLYYFGPDNKARGATKGVSVPKPGIWPILQIESPVAPD